MRRGADYLSAIAGDGRTVLLDGEPVADVSTHPGFAGPARVIASLYDSALERPDLAYEDGGRTSARCGSSRDRPRTSRPGGASIATGPRAASG